MMPSHADHPAVDSPPDRARRVAGPLVSAVAAGLHAAVVLAALAVPLSAFASALWRDRLALDAADTLVRWAPLLAGTVQVCGVALAVSIGGGLALGLLAARTDLRGRLGLLALAAFGAGMPVFAYAVFFFSLVASVHFADSAVACGVMYGLVFVPLSTLLLAALAAGLEPALEEQALLDAGAAAVLRRVTLPRMAPGVTVCGLIVVVLVATDVLIADVLMVPTFAREVYSQYALRGARLGPLLTALPLLGALLIVLALLRFHAARLHLSFVTARAARPFKLGRWRTPVSVLVWLIATLAAVGGLGPVLAQAESPARFLESAGSMRGEFATSFGLAACGATAVVAFGPGLAWAALRARRGRTLLCGGLIVLLAMPAPVIGIALIELLNRPGWTGELYDSPAILVLGYVVRFLPLGAVLLLPAILRTPTDLERAARIDGCDWLAVQRHVYWPAAFPDAAAAWLIVFVLCFGDVGATVLLAPPGWPTASVRAMTLIHFGVYQDLATLTLLSLAALLAPVAALCWLFRRMMRAG